MYLITRTAKFKRAYKLAVKRGLNMSKLNEVIGLLAMGEPLDYTKWRERNMYLDGDLHALAERARRTGAKFEATRQKRKLASAMA